MADGEGRAPSVSIDRRSFIRAIEVLTFNYFVLAVAGFGNYKALHEEVDLSPECRIKTDGSIMVSFDRAAWSDKPMAKNFIDTFFTAINKAKDAQHPITEAQLQVDKDRGTAYFKSLATFYNLIIVLYNASEFITDPSTDTVELEGDTVQTINTQLSSIKKTIFPFDTGNCRPC